MAKTIPPKIDYAEAANELLRRREARASLLSFMDYCWWMPDPLLKGIHTRAICERLTRAVDDYLNGISSFLLFEVCFRHGKTDIGSRAFPAYFLGRCAAKQPDVIIDSYGSDLSESFSRKVQAIMEQDSYRMLFPGVTINPKKSAVANWSVEGSAGEVTVAGVGGGFTGKGGALIVGDDMLKNREEAESEGIRDKVWDHIRNDLLTRRAPVSIVVFMGTPWHVDDHFHRIRQEMANNPKFPRFEIMTFPAESPKYPGGYLFPERFSTQWYAEQRATLGMYNAAGLMDCDPTYRGGNMIKTDRIAFVDGGDIPPGLLWVRVWDLASTEKERAKADPDYTAGALVAYREDKDKTPTLYVSDVKFLQAEAPERDKLIKETSEKDGPGVWQGVEKIAGYKDAYTTMRDVMEGRSIVHGIECPKDKVLLAAESIEALFEGGRVVIRKGWWNDHVTKELSQFPKGKHDDIVDAIAKGAKLAKERWKQAAEGSDVVDEAFIQKGGMRGLV